MQQQDGQEQQRRIARLLKRINGLQRNAVYQIDSQNGLYYGQLLILEFVYRHQPCSQKQLVDQLQVSPPSIAASIKRMQRAGLLEKAADTSDLRCNRITITEKGRRHMEQCQRDFAQLNQQMFLGFSAEDYEQLLAYLQRIAHNLDPAKRPVPPPQKSFPGTENNC